MTDYVTLLRAAVLQGHPIDVSLAALREQGASPIDSIKAVREVTGVSLADAKRVVSESTAWDDIRESHAKFVHELVDAIEAETDDS
jgi:ribosomal protein L7/L12